MPQLISPGGRNALPAKEDPDRKGAVPNDPEGSLAEGTDGRKWFPNPCTGGPPKFRECKDDDNLSAELEVDCGLAT
jgi:hypothetical protein